jgi:hypothetical protein
MTTGRINQVTIVCRGWPPARISALERFPSYWWRHEGAPYTAPSAGPTAPRTAIRFPPLSSPGHPSATLHPLWVVRLGGPRRRTQRGASTISVSATRGYLPLLSGRSSHRPVTHRAHPAAAGASSLRCSQASPVRRTAGAAGFVRVDSHYEPPAGEAGACKPVQRATQWSSIRSGTRSTGFAAPFGTA